MYGAVIPVNLQVGVHDPDAGRVSQYPPFCSVNPGLKN